jgi:hypothetical protein
LPFCLFTFAFLLSSPYAGQKKSPKRGFNYHDPLKLLTGKHSDALPLSILALVTYHAIDQSE